MKAWLLIDKHGECSQITSYSDLFKMLERRFVPKKDLNWRHPLPDKNSSPIGLF
jgi:hypothetical protein